MRCVRLSRRFTAGGLFWRSLLVAALRVRLPGSVKPALEQHFYDQHIQPIFNNFCVGNTSPCHRIDQPPASRWATWICRRSRRCRSGATCCAPTAATRSPLLLLEGAARGRGLDPVPAAPLASEIRHAGGKPIAPNSDAYYELKRWLDNGANRDGIAPRAGGQHGAGRLQHGAAAAGAPADRRHRVGRVSRLRRPDPAQAAGVVRVRHLPQLAAVGFLPDLRRRRRAEGRSTLVRPPASWPRPGSPSSRARSCCGRWRPRRAASATPAASSSSRARTTPGRPGRPGRSAVQDNPPPR